jgi:uncharacterized protein YhbP (UPF0306 family)
VEGPSWRTGGGDEGTAGDPRASPYDDEGVADVLRGSTMSLATAGATGRPFSTPVFFAADEVVGLIFFSDADTLHVRHLLERSEASATVYPTVNEWLEIRGLQIAGTVERILPGEAWERAWQTYQAKFPFVADLRALIEVSWLLALVPTWIRLIDNRRAFGYKREWIRGPAFEKSGAAPAD